MFVVGFGLPVGFVVSRFAGFWVVDFDFRIVTSWFCLLRFWGAWILRCWMFSVATRLVLSGFGCLV